MARGDCSRCRQPAILNGLCAEHLALGADPRRDKEGLLDDGVCACGASFTRCGLKDRCDPCRRKAAGEDRICANAGCGNKVNPRAPRAFECDPCKWSKARGESRS